MAAAFDTPVITAPSRTARRFAPALLLVALALPVGACQSVTPTALTDSFSNRPPPPPTEEAALRAYAENMAPRYAANPTDKTIALHYATALRGLGQRAQAVAIIQGLAVKQPHDMEVLAAYGKALADAGRLQEAAAVLERAHTPDRPNWSVLSAQGSVADQLGNHRDAQAYYAAALQIVPNQPDVLSNLGLSYALEHRLPQAEATLLQAVAQPGADIRVRQNLAMVLSLEGKYAGAEDVSRRDMAPVDAAENVASIKQTINQSDTWAGSKADPRSAARRGVPPVRTASTVTN